MTRALRMSSASGPTNALDDVGRRRRTLITVLPAWRCKILDGRTAAKRRAVIGECVENCAARSCIARVHPGCGIVLRPSAFVGVSARTGPSSMAADFITTNRKIPGHGSRGGAATDTNIFRLRWIQWHGRSGSNDRSVIAAQQSRRGPPTAPRRAPLAVIRPTRTGHGLFCASRGAMRDA